MHFLVVKIFKHIQKSKDKYNEYLHDFHLGLIIMNTLPYLLYLSIYVCMCIFSHIYTHVSFCRNIFKINCINHGISTLNISICIPYK